MTWVAWLTKVLLVAVLVVALLGVVSEVYEIKLLYRAVHGGALDSELEANDSLQVLVTVVLALVYFVTGTSFLIWFYLGRRNLACLGGRKFKYTPRWAVAGFFVPLLNIVRPFEVMCEVWHGSDPAGFDRDRRPSGSLEREKLGAPSLVKWWWGIFLTGNVLAHLVFRMAISENQSIDYMYIQSGLWALANLVEIVEVVVAIRLISRITKWQRIRHEHAVAIGVS